MGVDAVELVQRVSHSLNQRFFFGIQKGMMFQRMSYKIHEVWLQLKLHGEEYQQLQQLASDTQIPFVDLKPPLLQPSWRIPWSSPKEATLYLAIQLTSDDSLSRGTEIQGGTGKGNHGAKKF